MFIEEDVDDASSVYDAFYNKYFDGWTEEFGKYRSKVRNVSDLVGDREKKVGRCYPSKQHLFDALEMTPLSKVKVVIWAPEPYSSLNQDGRPRAQGYAFGVAKNDIIPKPLLNIYTELKNELPGFQIPRHGNLSGWTNQGILMMNMALCYSPKDPKAFSDLWIRFSNIIIQIINEKVPNCIHLLWGKKCEQLADSINSREVYTTSHPSCAYQGFFGCNHFIKTNITLQRQNKTPIDWGRL